MTEHDLPQLIQILTQQIPDGDHRSHALEELVRHCAVWHQYTVAQWASWCRQAAFRAHVRHQQRRVQWGIRAKNRCLPEPIMECSLTPLRRLELKEELTQADTSSARPR